MQPPPAGSGGGLPARGSCWAAPAELTRLRDGIPAPNTELRGFRFLFFPLPKSTLHSPLPPPPRQCSHPLCSGGGRGGARKCFLGQPVQRGITGSGAGAGKQSPAARRGKNIPAPRLKASRPLPPRSEAQPGREKAVGKGERQRVISRGRSAAALPPGMGREATGAEARCPEIRLDRTVHPVIPSDCPTWAWRGLAWVQSPAWGMRFHDFFIFFFRGIQ